MTAKQILESYDLYWGRMLCSSKTGYRKEHPDNLVVFNATMVLKSGEIFPMMDLDLTLDKAKLQCAAKQIGEFIILREGDSCGLDSKNYEQLKEKAAKIYV